MKKALVLLAAVFLQAGAWALTYTYTGPTYNSPTHDFTAPCAAGTCTNFTTAMRQTGSMTTNQPLPPNLNHVEVSSYISGYSFSDGVTQYISSGIPQRLLYAYVTTDAAGNITDSDIVIIRWQTANHQIGGRIDHIAVNQGSFSNEVCAGMGNPGMCTATTEDTSTSYAFAQASNGGWTPIALPTAQSVPVGNPFALLLTATGLLGLALRGRRELLLER